MNRYLDFIKLKERLSKGAFERQELKSLEHDIDALMAVFWGTHDDQIVMQPSVALDDLCTFHLTLVKSVSNIIKKNYSTVNEVLLRTNLSAREVLNKAVDGKTADGIALFSAAKTYFIIGDIHADYGSLKRIFKTAAFFETENDDHSSHLIFMGDYVDRGKAQLKTIEYLLIMKALFPDRITLLRGNHDGGIVTESGITCLPYRIPESDDPLRYFPRYLEALKISNPSFSSDLLPAYLDLFDKLPYIAFIKQGDQVVECVHGGLPKPNLNAYEHLTCLSDLTQYPLLDNTESTILHNIMWSDPQKTDEDLLLNGKRFKYSEAHFYNYASHFHVDTLFRGHEVVADGIKAHFNDKLFTVFSSGRSPDSYYDWVTPKIVDLKPEGDRQFLPLTDNLDNL